MSRCQRSGCREQLPAAGRGPIPKFCSVRCRVAAHRASPVPLELRQRPRWLRHTAGKVPLTVGGAAASSTDPETWATYSQARLSKAGAGMGFVLNGDGIICLDLDHCIVDGELLWRHAAVLERLPDTYTEVSPSGDGLHLFLRGSLPRYGRVRLFGVPMEAYATGRYITVTGRRWADSPSKLAKL